jgi:hypothetical protein
MWQAYARFDPAKDPFPSRCVDEDFNRVWGDEVLLGPRDRSNCDAPAPCNPSWMQPTFVLDIHSA